MNIMVTGAGGFIGSHVCEALLERGDNVIAIDYFTDPESTERKKKNLAGCFPNLNFKFHDVDIKDKKDLDWIFYKTKPDKIIHLAAKTSLKSSIENPQLFKEVNVDATRNLLELSVKYKVKGFILASTYQVYGDTDKAPSSEEDELGPAMSPYAETKRQAEQLCREYADRQKLNITILRFFSVYGPRCRPEMVLYRFVDRLARDKPLQIHQDQKDFEKGLLERDFTYITDIVDGILLALDKSYEFEIFNLGRGHPIKLNDLIRLLEIATGVKASKEFIGKQEGELPISYADIRKARNLLGYDPEVTIEEGIKRFIRWYTGQDTDLFHNI